MDVEYSAKDHLFLLAAHELSNFNVGCSVQEGMDWTGNLFPL